MALDLSADCAVSFEQRNPKRKGSSACARYEIYKRAKTVGEALRLGAKSDDLRHDLQRKFLVIADDASTSQAPQLVSPPATAGAGGTLRSSFPSPARGPIAAPSSAQQPQAVSPVVVEQTSQPSRWRRHLARSPATATSSEKDKVPEEVSQIASEGLGPQSLPPRRRAWRLRPNSEVINADAGSTTCPTGFAIPRARAEDACKAWDGGKPPAKRSRVRRVSVVACSSGGDSIEELSGQGVCPGGSGARKQIPKFGRQRRRSLDGTPPGQRKRRLPLDSPAARRAKRIAGKGAGGVDFPVGGHCASRGKSSGDGVVCGLTPDLVRSRVPTPSVSLSPHQLQPSGQSLGSAAGSTQSMPCFYASEIAALIGLHCRNPALHAFLRCWRRYNRDSLRVWERLTGGVSLPEQMFARHASNRVREAVAVAARTGDGALPQQLEAKIGEAVRSSDAPPELWSVIVNEALGKARCARGTRLEVSGLDAYEQKFNRRVVRRNRDALRMRFGMGPAAFVLSGRADGFEEVDGESFVVEHKRRQRKLFRDVPDYEFVQCQAYMAMAKVSGCRWVQSMGAQVDARLLSRCPKRWACIEGRLRAVARLLRRLCVSVKACQNGYDGYGRRGRRIEPACVPDGVAAERAAASAWCPSPAELEEAHRLGWSTAPPWPSSEDAEQQDHEKPAKATVCIEDSSSPCKNDPPKRCDTEVDATKTIDCAVTQGATQIQAVPAAVPSATPAATEDTIPGQVGGEGTTAPVEAVRDVAPAVEEATRGTEGKVPARTNPKPAEDNAAVDPRAIQVALEATRSHDDERAAGLGPEPAPDAPAAHGDTCSTEGLARVAALTWCRPSEIQNGANLDLTQPDDAPSTVCDSASSSDESAAGAEHCPAQAGGVATSCDPTLLLPDSSSLSPTLPA